MAVTQPRTIGQPNYFRSVKNASGADIPAYRVVVATAAVDGGELGSDPTTESEVGVSVEILSDGGPARSVQVDGKAAVTAGAAVSIGDNVTWDSTGRAITASLSTQRVIGRAVTAAASAGDLIEVELRAQGRTVTSVTQSVADKAALKALTTMSNGDIVMLRSDRSFWTYVASLTTAADLAEDLIVDPTAAGDGRWVRADKAFIAKVPIAYTNTNGQAIWVIPAGFVLRLAGQPYWEIVTPFSGGSSSAIGLSTNITNLTTGGDLLGGASGDTTAVESAGVAAGTVGGGSATELHGLLMVAGTEIQFDRITSAYTAGAGFARIPVIVANAPA